MAGDGRAPACAPTPAPAPVPDAAAGPASAPAPSLPVVGVAVSGGRDSTALLHCTARQARTLGMRVVALHVHHGLMPQADAWLAQVRRQARTWGAVFAAERLEASPPRGASVEAWARRERYAALARLAHASRCGLVLLAHHRDDQAETVLLQALRGAGPAGLAAMPALVVRDGVTWARPWLQQPRSALDAYRRRHRLSCVDDTSNADPRFARSRLRSAVWPAMQAAFPHAAPALAMTARLAHEARRLALEVAEADLPAIVDDDASLDVSAWRRLTPARRDNALRAWLRRALPHALPESLLARLGTELPAAVVARWPAPGATVVLRGGRLRVDVTAAVTVGAPSRGGRFGAAVGGAPKAGDPAAAT